MVLEIHNESWDALFKNIIVPIIQAINFPVYGGKLHSLNFAYIRPTYKTVLRTGHAHRGRLPQK